MLHMLRGGEIKKVCTNSYYKCITGAKTFARHHRMHVEHMQNALIGV